MTLPTIDGMHYVGCHCNDPCTCDDIECVHEQCICDRLSAAYRSGREDAAEAVKDLIRQQLGYGKAEWIDDEDYEFIAAARGDGENA